jgi:NADH-quinone oxidoreductase subunit K
MITPAHYLVLGAVLFSIGVAGVLLRKNLLVILMSLELMFNAVNLTFAAFARQDPTGRGHLWVLMVIAASAAEAAVVLALSIHIFRSRGTLDTDRLDSLRY